MKLSVIIIAKNEEDKIKRALSSVSSFADEIILVDTGSTDKTREVAKSMNARVISYTKGGFSEWRVKGLSEAKGEWIFYLDADEEVTRLLADEISFVLSEEGYSWGVIPRKNIVFGKELKHGGLWPDYVKRLFRKDSIRGWSGELHEEPIVSGKMRYLVNPIVHYKHDNISEMVEKTNIWSEIEARLMFNANHPKMNILRFFSAGVREAWLRIFRQRAFLDGYVGMIYAIYQVFSRFVSYAKLWEMQIKKIDK